MFYDLTSFLLYAIAFSACFQPTAQRLYGALVFVSFTLLHEQLLSDLSGWAYYGSAALFDLVIITILSGIRPAVKMVYQLELISLLSILLNFIGWTTWYLYLPPIAYDVGFVLLYSWALYALIKRDTDVGDYTLTSWRSCFSSLSRKSFLLH